jgi:hypothetical protein
MRRKPTLAAAILTALLPVSIASATCPGGATCASIQAPPSLTGFCGGPVAVTVANTGTLTWKAAGPNPVHLSYHWLQGATTVVFDGTRTPLPHDVAPGGSVTLSAEVKRPFGAAGTYTLRFDMVEEGVTWFGAQGSPTADIGSVTVPSLLACGARAPSPVNLPVPGAPHIEDCSPQTTPGGSVVCWGSAFGAFPGKVFFAGLKKYDGTTISGPQAELSPATANWSDGGFMAGVSSGLTGFVGQQVGVRVENAKGLLSNVVYVHIEPLLDVLPAGDTAVRVTCAGRWDTCRYLGPLSGLWDAGHSSSGFVANGDKGTDVYSGNLKNGWRFVDDGTPVHNPRVDFRPDPDHSAQTGPPDVTGKFSVLSVSVPWHYDWGFGNAGTWYLIGFMITGPRDVPWN